MLGAPSAYASGSPADLEMHYFRDLPVYIEERGFFSGAFAGTGESILNMFSGMFWSLALTIAGTASHIVYEAFTLDVIGDAFLQIGQAVHRLVGVNPAHIETRGLLPTVLFLAVILTGFYVGYLAIFKREVANAVGKTVRFVVVFLGIVILSSQSMVILRTMHNVSLEISNSLLDVGVQLATPHGQANTGEGGPRGMQNLVLDLTVRQPWLMFTFGTTDISSLENGEERVREMMMSHADTVWREEVLRAEVETYGNIYVGNASGRLANVLLLVVINSAISFYVVLLSLLLALSQLLFVFWFFIFMFAMVLSLIPGFDGAAQRGMERFIRAFLLRIGYTLILVLAFALSSIVFSAAAGRPFFFIAILQIIVFAGIYKTQDEVMGLLCMSGADNHRLGRGVGAPFQRIGRGASRVGRMLILRHWLRGGRNNNRNNVSSGNRSNDFGGRSSGGGGTSPAPQSPQTNPNTSSVQRSQNRQSVPSSNRRNQRVLGSPRGRPAGRTGSEIRRNVRDVRRLQNTQRSQGACDNSVNIESRPRFDPASALGVSDLNRSAARSAPKDMPPESRSRQTRQDRRVERDRRDVSRSPGVWDSNNNSRPNVESRSRGQ